MPDNELDRLLFDRIWAMGAKAVHDNHIWTLAGATLNAHKLDDVDRITAGLEPEAH